MEDLVPFLGETQPVSKLPWKIGAMESGRIALDSDDNKEVTGFIESEDAFYILGQQQTIERQAAQIEMLQEALDYYANPTSDLFPNTARKALSTTPDQALEQFAERVREQCAQVCNSADKSTHPADLADAIKELP